MWGQLSSSGVCNTEREGAAGMVNDALETLAKVDCGGGEVLVEGVFVKKGSVHPSQGALGPDTAERAPGPHHCEGLAG